MSTISSSPSFRSVNPSRVILVSTSTPSCLRKKSTRLALPAWLGPHSSGRTSSNCVSSKAPSRYRTDQTVTGGSCTAFRQLADGNNRLLGYGYDAAGNMTNDGNHSFYYDAENRLVQVGGALGTCSTATACYLYDAEGKRVQKSVGSAQTIYLYDLSRRAINELDANNVTLTNYIYANGNLLAQYKNSTTYFVHQEHLGSSTIVTSISGAVA